MIRGCGRDGEWLGGIAPQQGKTWIIRSQYVDLLGGVIVSIDEIQVDRAAWADGRGTGHYRYLVVVVNGYGEQKNGRLKSVIVIDVDQELDRSGIVQNIC